MPNDQDRQSLFDLLREIASAITRGYTFSQAAEKAAREMRATVERRVAGGGVGSVLDGLRPGNAKDITAMLGEAVRSLPEIKALPELASISHWAVAGAMPRIHNPKSTRSLTKRGPWATVSQSATSFHGSLPPVLSGYGLPETAPGDFGVTSAVAGAGVPNAKMSVWEKRAMGILPQRQRSEESQHNIRMKMLEYATANVVKGFGVLGRTLMGGIGVVSSLAGFGTALNAFSNRVIENNRDFQVYSAQLAMTYARTDFNQRIRDAKVAKEAGPAMAEAAEAGDIASEAWLPVRIFLTKLWARTSEAAKLLVAAPLLPKQAWENFDKSDNKAAVAGAGLAEVGATALGGWWAGWKGSQLFRWLRPKMPGGWLPPGMGTTLTTGARWLGAAGLTVGATNAVLDMMPDSGLGLGFSDSPNVRRDRNGIAIKNPSDPLKQLLRAQGYLREDDTKAKTETEKLTKAMEESNKLAREKLQREKKAEKDEKKSSEPNAPKKQEAKEPSDKELQSLWQGHLLEILNYGKNPHIAPANKRVGEK